MPNNAARTAGRHPIEDGRVLVQMAIRLHPDVLADVRSSARERNISYAVAMGELVEQAHAANDTKNE